MGVFDVFIGSPQSKYAGLAFLITLIVVSIAVLISKESIPVGQKFIVVLLLILFAIPGILLNLFQITCLVTGTNGGKAWWCDVYAWLISILVIISSLLVVIAAIMSMASESKMENFIGSIDNSASKANLEKMNQKAAEFFANGGKTNPLSKFTPGPIPETAAVVPPANSVKKTEGFYNPLPVDNSGPLNQVSVTGSGLLTPNNGPVQGYPERERTTDSPLDRSHKGYGGPYPMIENGVPLYKQFNDGALGGVVPSNSVEGFTNQGSFPTGINETSVVSNTSNRKQSPALIPYSAGNYPNDGSISAGSDFRSTL